MIVIVILIFLNPGEPQTLPGHWAALDTDISLYYNVINKTRYYYYYICTYVLDIILLSSDVNCFNQSVEI